MIESFGEGPAVSGTKPVVLWSGVPNKGGGGGGGGGDGNKWM